MSTYTDLHNKIRETINVDYHSRATNQEVKLLNHENEYWGTLRGKVDIRDGVISGVTLVGATLKDVKLPSGVNIDEINTTITSISTHVDTLEEQTGEEFQRIELDYINKINDAKLDAADKHAILSGMVHEVSVALSTGLHNQDDARENIKRELSTYTDSQVTILNGSIEGLNTELVGLSNQVSAISSEILSCLSNETEILVSADNELSNHISDLSSKHIKDCEEISAFTEYLSSCAVLSAQQSDSKIELEAAERIALEARLNDKIEDVEAIRDSQDDALADMIEEHRVEVSEDLSVLEDQLLSTILHDKHYEIYQNGLDASYPYKLKDYAVNILKTDAVDAYITHKGNVIGKLSKIPNQEGAVKIEILDFDDDEIKNALTKSTYIFPVPGEGGYSASTNVNGYQITYNKRESLEDSVFKLDPDKTPYLTVYQNGSIIGKIKGFKVVNNTIIEGTLTIDTSNTLLTAFNGYPIVFNSNDKISCNITDESNRIIYNKDNTFDIQKNIKTKEFEVLQDINTPESTIFGKVYKDGGLISSDNGIEEIIVNLDIPYNTSITLDREHNFTNILTSTNEMSTIISANVDHNTFDIGVDIVEVAELYKYDFKLNDDTELTGNSLGYVIPEAINSDIEAGQFAKLSVVLDESAEIKIEAFKGVLEFTIDNSSNLKIWRCAKTDEFGNALEGTFDGTILNIWNYIKNSGISVTRKYRLDLASKTIYNGETCHKHIFTSAAKIFKFENKEEYFEEAIKLFADHNAKESSQLESYELGIDTVSANDIKFIIPNKQFNDISREFYVAIKIFGSDKDINITFVDESGNPIDFITGRKSKLFVKTNIFTTMMFNEINHNVFLITDLDHNAIDAKIEKYNSDLNTRITGIQGEVHQLSNELNVVLTDIQTQIYSNDEDITYLSSNVASNYADIINLSTEISSNDVDIEYLSSEISSNDVDIEYLSSEISSNDVDIAYLSNEISSNDVDIAYLSNEISSNDVDIEYLSSEISSNDADIAYLSNEISSNDADIINLTKTDETISASLDETKEYFDSHISEIYTRIKGAINYKGVIKLFDNGIYNVSSVSSMFIAGAYGDITIEPLYKDSGTVLSNGFLYAVSKIDGSPKSHFEIEGLNIEAGDYVIINNRNSNDVIISNMTSADIDIIDAMDDDLVTLELANQLSTELTTNINSETARLDGRIDSEITRATEAESKISSDLSSEISIRSSEDSVISTAIDNKIKVQNSFESDILSVETITIHKLGQADYEQLIKEDKIIESDLYEVSAEYVNGYGCQAKYIAPGVEEMDAVNVGQLSSISSDLNTNMVETTTAISEELSLLNDHYSKTFVKDQTLIPGVSDKVDFLKLTDKTDPEKNYTMQLSGGTIVLVPIK